MKCLIKIIKNQIVVGAKACPNPGSNQGPYDLQSHALPTELFGLVTTHRPIPVLNWFQSGI